MNKSAQRSQLPNSEAKPGGVFRSLAWMLILLVLALGLFFGRSLDPASVLFANDAPLGALAAQESIALSNFLGAWQDLNWIGAQQPSALPNVTYGFYLLAGALGYAKFYTPLALLLLGLSAWFFFHRAGLSSGACLLGGLAAALNTDPFSYACWGLAPIALCLAATFAALALLENRAARAAWVDLLLAGMLVGLGVMEGYDTGAILSLYVAGFLLFRTWLEPGTTAIKLRMGIVRLAAVALLAALLSAHALSTLVGTQIKNIAGVQQDPQSKAQRWDGATQWSLPKIETLRVLIAGLFGYRMDTPPEGGPYWGSVGQDPNIERLQEALSSPNDQIRAQAAAALRGVLWRHSGSGVYAGVLVVVIALFALAQALRGRKSGFNSTQRRAVLFWAGGALVSLLFAWGRHAPFYQFIFHLPFFSTIRNPVKFMHPFTISLVILFGYGVDVLVRSHLKGTELKEQSFGQHVKNWWAAVAGFDRKWVMGMAVCLGLCGLVWLLYAKSQTSLQRHLSATGFGQEQAIQIAKSSVLEFGWFLFFFGFSAGLMAVILSGWFSGRRARIGLLLLGAVLVSDLMRANQPWVVYWNYKEKYASNPVLDFLRRDPQDHRVAARLSPRMSSYLVNEQGQLLPPLHNEWLQHHFQYYRLQTVDIVQMPRTPELDEAFLRALTPRSEADLTPVGRLWQLTNTRFVLGQAAFLPLLNQAIDPQFQRFRIQTGFDIVLKHPDQNKSALQLEDLTAQVNTNGRFALFEFTGALPRTQLYTRWQTVTNDQDLLQTLATPSFDPAASVLIAPNTALPLPAPDTNAPPGSVKISNYSPKRVVIEAQTAAPAVLLLNDKFHPDWKVRVNGREQPLLRCNFIMRGVFLEPGSRRVEFSFEPPVGSVYVSLSALGLALVLIGVRVYQHRHQGAAAPKA